MVSKIVSCPTRGSVGGNTVVLGEPEPFDEQNPRWKTCGCCRSSMQVRYSMQVIAILDIVFEVILMVLLVSCLSNKDSELRLHSISGLAGAPLIIFVSVLAFWGIRRIRPGLLIPSIILRAFTIISSAVFGSVEAVRGFDSYHNYIDPRTNNDTRFNDNSTAVLVGTIVSCIVIIVLQVWFFIVFVRGYYYLKEKHHWQMTIRYPVPIIAYPNPGFQTHWQPTSLAGLAGNGISVVNPGAQLNQYLPANQAPSYYERSTHETTPTPTVHTVQT